MAVGDLPAGSGVKLKVLITSTDTVIGSQTTFNSEERRNAIDYSSKDSLNRRVLGGRYSGTVTLDAVYVPADTAQNQVRDDIRAGNLHKITIAEDGADDVDVQALPVSYSFQADDDDVAVLSISYEIDDQWAAAT